METTSPKVPQLAPEQILRACDYVELVWQDDEEAWARLEEFHRDGKELAQLLGEFGALLLDRYLTIVPAGHVDCEAGRVRHGQAGDGGHPVPQAVVLLGWRGAVRVHLGGVPDRVHAGGRPGPPVPRRHPPRRLRRAAVGRDLSRTGRGSARGRRSLLPRVLPALPAVGSASDGVHPRWAPLHSVPPPRTLPERIERMAKSSWPLIHGGRARCAASSPGLRGTAVSGSGVGRVASSASGTAPCAAGPRRRAAPGAHAVPVTGAAASGRP